MNKIPPQDLSVEKTVIGSMLMDSEAVDTGIELLTPGCFYHNQHKNAFISIQSLHRLDIEVDIYTLVEEMKKQQTYTDGVEAYLSEMVEGDIGTVKNIESHCKILIEKMRSRELIKLSLDVINKCFDNTPADDVLCGIDKTLIDISDFKVDNSPGHISEITPIVMSETKTSIETGNTGITTGYKTLDEKMGFMQSGDYIILAARPSMGKTAFAINIALNCALIAQKPVLIFSLEMTRAKIARRLFSCQCGINGVKFRSGGINQDEYIKMQSKKSEIDTYPIYIKDESLTVYQIRTAISRYYRKYGIGLVVIDYLQLMKDTGLYKDNRRLETGERSRVLKVISKELGIPIIAICQLSRNLEGRTQKFKRPVMSDLKESGELEQDADIIMFLYRPFEYGQSQNPEEIEIIIGKNRDGPVGTIELRYTQKYNIFKELIKDDEEGEF